MDESAELKEKLTKENIAEGLKILLRYLSKYKKETIVLSIIGIVSALGNGIVPYIAGRFFDSIMLPGTTDLLGLSVPLFAAILAAWALVQLITYFVDWQINIRSESLSNAAWTDYMASGFAHLVELPMSFHKSHKIGEESEKINRAAYSFETILGRIVIDLAPQFLSIAIAFAVTFWIEPKLALILIFGVLLYAAIMTRSVQPVAKIQREYHEKLSKAWGDAFETAANAQTTKQATAEAYERKRLDTQWAGILLFWNKLNAVWANLTLYQRIIILGTQITIFLLSIAMIRGGSMTIGELIAFNAYAAMMFGPFVTLGRSWQSVQNGITALSQAQKILDLEPEMYRPKDCVELKEIKGDIEFSNVDFSYDEDKTLLKDINLSVAAGEVVALVGESGVGKSTIIDLISGFHFATAGTVSIDGVDIRKLDLRFLRKNIGVVPQEVVLFNDTIEYNLRYGSFEATKDELEEAARKAHAYDFIEKFPQKWEQVVGERGVKLSVGQKQRIAIARAMLRKPRILILDEPTSALDAGSEKIITKSLEELMAARTTFIVAHRLSTVRKADKIVVFKEGRIVEVGKHDELLLIEGGEYRRLYELQIGLHD
jgi:ABC-type multidrug transport system fused ATPase/permease subunit